MSKFAQKRTGAIRFRSGLFGRLVLQVEETYMHTGDDSPGQHHEHWRDAKATDLPLPFVLVKETKP